MSGKIKSYLIVKENGIFLLNNGKLHKISNINMNLFKSIELNSLLSIDNVVFKELSSKQTNFNEKDQENCFWKYRPISSDKAIIYNINNKLANKEANLFNKNLEYENKTIIDFYFKLFKNNYNNKNSKHVYYLNILSDGYLIKEKELLNNFNLLPTCFNDIYENLKEEQGIEFLINLYDFSEKIIPDISFNKGLSFIEIPYHITMGYDNIVHIDLDIVKSEISLLISNIQYYLKKIYNDIIVFRDKNDFIEKITRHIFLVNKIHDYYSINFEPIFQKKSLFFKLFKMNNVDINEIKYIANFDKISNAISIKAVYRMFSTDWYYGINIKSITEKCNQELFAMLCQGNLSLNRFSEDKDLLCKRLDLFQFEINVHNYFEFCNQHLKFSLGHLIGLNNLLIARIN